MSDAGQSVDSSNLGFIEEMYASYVRDPNSVSTEWQKYFQSVANGDGVSTPPRSGPSFQPAPLFGSPTSTKAVVPDETQNVTWRERLNQLIHSYRVRGHMIAKIDPLGLPREMPEELDPAFWGFTEAELDRQIPIKTFLSAQPVSVREILERLRRTYCNSIGVQYMHIDDLKVRRWLQERMETTGNRLELSHDEQTRILTRLTHAVIFEEFIRKKFIGSKSFSLEGSESLIPLLDLAIEKAAGQGVKEIVLGMAHRGRLNVLANIIGKKEREIFREFSDLDPDLYFGRGDVKYHLGYSSDWTTSSGQKVHLSLCFNPSHLEFVNPVVLGRLRAKQDRAQDTERTQGLALMIHGDAAFAGEGVTQETLNLCRLPGYCVGGTLHIIINNQIGFTTSPSEGRSSAYATDVARMLQVPIFHVNGEDPEAVAQVVRLAMDFRSEFKRDVFIDMYAYRRLGHNEGDEPAFTQPILYRAIKERKPVREGYLEHLLKLNEITREQADKISEQRSGYLENELAAARSADYKVKEDSLRGIWSKYVGGSETDAEVKTGAPVEKLAALLKAQTQLPADFHPHQKIQKFIEGRREMAEGKAKLDWSAAESLAFACTVTEGNRVRLSGQDCCRGTFSHRHAVLYDYENGKPYAPLKNLSADQAPFDVWNSPLSEIGVMGFDYGYSLDWPDGLILWEAQYGDFANAGQVIIDQFIVSAEDKWRRLSGLVLLLPHGFEGSGPEHSSARLERFLSLASEQNIRVVSPTTAAQYFHLLRRQVVEPLRKPLVVMTPKGLLRDPRVGSSLEEFAKNGFQRIIGDSLPPQKVKRILLCSGKVYYDLDAERQRLKREDVAIIRLEQLYPLAEPLLQKLLSGYAENTPVVWVQEEPENMGAWRYLRAHFGEKIGGKHPFSGVYRTSSASPATGSMNCHKKEQQQLLDAAFAPN